MRIGFTGTREGMTPPQQGAVHAVLSRLRAEGAEWLHHGDCVGADAEAHRIWRGLLGQVWLHPPADPSGRAFCAADDQSPPREYLARNLDIVHSTDVLVAAPRTVEETPRGGAWATVRAGRARGSTVVLVLPTGEVVREPGAQPRLDLG